MKEIANTVSQDVITEQLIYTSEKVAQIFIEGTAKNTIKAYRKDLLYFQKWFELTTRRLFEAPLDVAMVIKFIVDHTTGLDENIDKELVSSGIKARLGIHKVSTVERRLAALSVYHKQQGYSDSNPCTMPQVRELMKKVRKRSVKSGALPKKKKAITAEILQKLLAVCDDSLRGKRNKAILTFSFCSGGRRCDEISNALRKSLHIVGDDFTYCLHTSKTNQSGDKSLVVPVKGVAAKAMKEWLEVSKITDGQLFRGITKYGTLTDSLSNKAISKMIKTLVRKAGLDPKDFSPHSFTSVQDRSELKALSV